MVQSLFFLFWCRFLIIPLSWGENRPQFCRLQNMGDQKIMFDGCIIHQLNAVLHFKYAFCEGALFKTKIIKPKQHTAHNPHSINTINIMSNPQTVEEKIEHGHKL